MIYIERTINIEDNSAYIEEPVVLYKGDSNIEVQFIINNNPFKYKAGLDLTYGQLVIKRPTTDPIFSEVAKLSSNKVLFVITGDMIDELIELGNYDFQIRLLNADMSSRATLPPVSAGILIKEPICEEGVNTSPVNYSRAAISREIVDTFDEEGNYNKTEWSSGDIITDSKLNKIEDALYTINDNNGNYATKDEIPTAVSQLENDENYAKLSEVNAKITTVNLKKADKEHTHDEYITDISHLATKEELPTKTSELTNDSGYATEQYVDDAISNIDIPRPNLSNYATKQYVDDAIEAIEIPEPDLSNYATKDELPPIRVIGSDNPDEPYILTGNEFTDEEYENCAYSTVFFKNVTIKYTDPNWSDPNYEREWRFENEVTVVGVWYEDNEDKSIRYIDFVSPWGIEYTLMINPDGSFTLDYRDSFVWDSNLENYARKNEIPDIKVVNSVWRLFDNEEFSDGSEFIVYFDKDLVSITTTNESENVKLYTCQSLNGDCYAYRVTKNDNTYSCTDKIDCGGFASENYVNNLVGNIESLLGGI